MVKKLLVPGLVIGFALLASLPEAQARHCRRLRTCCQVGMYGNSYQQSTVYNQPIADSNAPQISNASFTSTCCNPQRACVAQGFQGNGLQDGQYRPGYQPNGSASPPPPAEEPPVPQR